MKKIMISLLMVAAALNAMAITYTGKVQVVLRATSNNAACGAVVATSDALNDGLNSTYYAELNDEGKEVLVYVEYNNVRYEHFGSSSATMQNMPLIMKANASGEYRMNFYEMEGAIEIYDKVAGANIDKSQPYVFTIDDAKKNTIIADRFVINYVAPTPAEPSLCFSYNVLEINGHDGESLVIKQGTTEIDNVAALGATYSKDLSAYTGRLVVTLNGQDYQIDANPAVQKVNP